MRVFAYVLAAHAFAFGIGATANAADMFSMEDDVCGSWKDEPCEKPALWSGLYIGGFVGGGWGSSDIEDEYYYEDHDPLARNTIDLSALMAGLNVGYNVQNGNFVMGIEAGLGFMNLSGSVTDDDLRPVGSNWNSAAWGDRNLHAPISGTYDLSGNLYGELTGKIGYARNQSLFYVKGGGAFLQANFDAHYVGQNCSTISSPQSWSNCASYNLPDNPSTFDFGQDETLLGWTVGLGFQHAIGDRTSLKLEYQHFDFGNISYKYSGTDVYSTSGRNWTSTLNGDVNADVTLDVVKLGINYKLQD